jgi:hypothetical protein
MNLSYCVIRLTAVMSEPAEPNAAQYTFVNRSRVKEHLVSPKFSIFRPGIMASGLLFLPYFGD